MFGDNSALLAQIENLTHDLSKAKEDVNRQKDTIHDLQIKMKDTEADHGRELKEKDFEMIHFKDEELLKLRTENNTLTQEIAVLKKQIEMLDRIVALDADIIDVKSLIEQLIGKLPEINLQSLTVNNSK